MSYFTRISLCLSLLLSACAHTPVAKPVAFGFYAVQCVAVRDVYCALDATFTAQMCARMVPQAVEGLNKAVGREILHYAGTEDSLDRVKELYAQGSILVFSTQVKDWPNFNTLASTHPHNVTAHGSVCIDTVAIAVSPEVTGLKPGLSSIILPITIIEHELAHAIGAEHADPNSGFSSIMDPSAQHGASYFTPADIRALRATYCPEKLDEP